ncbi:hypothetical protein ACN3E9_11425 [Vibrio pectenicida]|uniref:hypothetical protein n=1 Tax=Vibrio pectenicida TaxID=62763 RepID=UPI003B9BA08C
MKYHNHTFLSLVTPSRAVSCCRFTFHLLTTYTAIGCFWVAMVGMAAQSATLGGAPEGYVNIYGCEDGTTIPRHTVKTRPICPGSKVEAIPIVDSAQYTIKNVYSLLQAYYLMGLILALGYQTFIPPIRQRLNLQP